MMAETLFINFYRDDVNLNRCMYCFSNRAKSSGWSSARSLYHSYSLYVQFRCLRYVWPTDRFYFHLLLCTSHIFRAAQLCSCLSPCNERSPCTSSGISSSTQSYSIVDFSISSSIFSMPSSASQEARMLVYCFPFVPRHKMPRSIALCHVILFRRTCCSTLAPIPEQQESFFSGGPVANSLIGGAESLATSGRLRVPAPMDSSIVGRQFACIICYNTYFVRKK